MSEEMCVVTTLHCSVGVGLVYVPGPVSYIALMDWGV